MLGSFLPPVVVELTANATELLASIKESEVALGRLEAQAEATGASLSGMQKASVVAGAAFKAMAFAGVAFAALSVKAAMDTETAFSRLDKALKNTGNGAASTSEEMKKIAEENTRLGFTTKSTADALGTLVTATGSTKEATALLGSAMNFARYNHTSLSNAADTMAKATQGSAKAFKELGITLDTSLPKQDAINKAFDQLNAKLSGQALTYTKTFAGQMQVLGANAEKVAEKFGAVLIPILQKTLDFIGKFGTQLLWLGGIIGGIVVAIKLYETALALWKGIQAAAIVVGLAWNALMGVQTAMTEAQTVAVTQLTGAQTLLNIAMSLNPIGLIVTAVGLLIAGLVLLYTKTTTIRNGMIDMAQSGIRAVGWLIQIFGDFVKAIMFVTTGPLHLFLKALAALHFPGAKAGLDVLNGAIKQTGDFFDKAATKVTNYALALDGLKKHEFIGRKTQKKSTSTDGQDPSSLDSYTGADTAAIKAAKAAAAAAKKAAAELKKRNDTIKKLNDEASKLYDDMNKVIADAKDSYDQLVSDRNSRDLNAQETYNDAKFNLERTFNDDLYKLNRDSGQKIDKLNRSFNDAKASADKVYADSKIKIETDNAAKLLEIQNTYNDAVTKATQDAVDKRQSIVQKSIDLLTGAFSSATGIDVGNIFASLLPKDNQAITNSLFKQVKDGVNVSVSWWGSTQEAGIGGLIDQLKTKLQGAKDLADNAAKLAAA